MMEPNEMLERTEVAMALPRPGSGDCNYLEAKTSSVFRGGGTDAGQDGTPMTADEVKTVTILRQPRPEWEEPKRSRGANGARQSDAIDRCYDNPGISR